MGWVRETHYASFMTKVAQFSCEIALKLRFASFLCVALHIVADGRAGNFGLFPIPPILAILCPMLSFGHRAFQKFLPRNNLAWPRDLPVL
jgi:hypothetical protein